MIIAAMASAIVFAGCSKEDSEPPELPPMESLVMDFSDFNNPSDTLQSLKAAGTYHNWGVAFLSVSVWNAMITLGTAVPVAAYAEALRQNPVYLGDSRWEWSYDITVMSIQFSASLIAERISNEEFTAEMYITRPGAGGFEDFKWYEGTIRYDHTGASWTLYENPANPSPIVTIVWNRDWEAGSLDLTYTNVKAGDNENGSFISFSVDPSKEYDAAYTISLSAGVINIEWNRETKAGRIKSPVRFGNSMWHCWNSSLQSMVCP